MDHQEIARAFVDARRDGRPLPTYPGEMPTGLADAYRIQDEAIMLRGGEIVGWKVGTIAAALQVPGQPDRTVGPIFADTVVPAGGEIDFAIVDGGFCAFESEFVIRIDTDLAPRSWTAEEIAAVAHTVHVGIELAGSPYPEITQHGPAVFVSDLGNNLGLVLGPPLPVGADLATLQVRTAIDGELVGEATGAAVPGGVFHSLAQAVTVLASRGRGVPAGTLFATGGVTGGHQVVPGQLGVSSFAGQPDLTVRLTALPIRAITQKSPSASADGPS